MNRPRIWRMEITLHTRTLNGCEKSALQLAILLGKESLIPIGQKAEWPLECLWTCEMRNLEAPTRTGAAHNMTAGISPHHRTHQNIWAHRRGHILD
jgi:hypothetical protein